MTSPWRPSWRADPAVAALADRHYSRKTPGAAQFSPPARVLVLKTADRTAGWVSLWPKAEFVLHDWAGAWINTLFRKEGPGLASDMIHHAVAHTRAFWPDVPPLGMVTLIDPRKIRSRNPGYCYLMAGFRRVGYTRSGLHVLQMLPEEMPPPSLCLGGSRRCSARRLRERVSPRSRARGSAPTRRQPRASTPCPCRARPRAAGSLPAR